MHRRFFLEQNEHIFNIEYLFYDEFDTFKIDSALSGGSRSGKPSALPKYFCIFLANKIQLQLFMHFQANKFLALL